MGLTVSRLAVFSMLICAVAPPAPCLAPSATAQGKQIIKGNQPSPAKKTSESDTSPPKAGAALRAFVLQMPHLEERKPETKAAGPIRTEEVGDETVVTSPFETTLTLEELAGFNPNHGVLWPGSLIQGKTLAGGTLAAVPAPHGPQVVVLSTLASAGKTAEPVSKRVQNPSLATVEKARRDLLKSGFLPPAKLSYTMSQYYSLDHAMMQIGARVSWLNGAVAASLQSDRYNSQTNVTVKFTQEYYSFAVEPPHSPVAFFDPDVTVEDLEPYANARDNPITYVQSVTYGRMALLLVSSKESYENLTRALSASVSWMTGSATVNYTDDQKKILRESQISLIVFGGSAENALQLVSADPLSHLQKWVQEKVNPGTIQFGLPISYRVNYLKDNQIARLSFTTDYRRVERTAIPQLTDWQITFYTLDDDKDDDTHLSVKVYRPNGSTVAQYEQTGKKLYPNNSRMVERLDQAGQGKVYLREVGGLRVRVHIEPNGHDTWRFKFVLTAKTVGGVTYSYSSPDRIELTENRNRRTFEVPLPAYRP